MCCRLQPLVGIRLAGVLAIFAVGPIDASAQECLRWEDRSPPPQHRQQHAMAYDTARNLTLVFGGYASTGGSARNDLWQWDGATWQEAPQSGDWPSPRRAHSMAFDANRNVAVVFGGYTSAWDASAETWEWDGAAWSQRSAEGPSARADAAMAFDSQRGVTVLFGGMDAATDRLGDTWEWDGTDWTLRSTIGPSPRDKHCMAYDSQRQVTVLFGGFGSADDTWEWDGIAWTQRLSTGPSVLWSCAMAYDSTRQRLVLTEPPKTWQLSSAGSTWIEGSSTQPGERGRHAMAFDSARGVTVLMGGSDIYSLRDTWEWDGSNWVDRTEPASGPSYAGVLAYDPVQRATVMAADDTYQWDGASWTLLSDGDVHPHPAFLTALVFDESRGVAVGFRASLTQPNETWEWDGASWEMRTQSGPGPRRNPALTYDRWRQHVLLFGGTGQCHDEPEGEVCEALTDTWAWNGQVWTLLNNAGPPRGAGAISFNSMRGAAVLYGGYDENPWWLCPIPTTQTWEWDGYSWAMHDGLGPVLWEPKSVYDPIRGLTVVRSAWECDIDDSETWEWDGTQWTDRAGGPSTSAEVAFDRQRRTVVAAGEANGEAVVWELVNDCSCASPMLRPYGERFSNCAGECYAGKNRYISFAPPAAPGCGSTGVALRVTLTDMPGADDCPKIPDFSAAQGAQMWVGPQVATFSNSNIPIFALQTAPLFRDWTTVPGGLVHISDCNVAPCATYTVEAIADTEYPNGAYSAPLVLPTASRWGDVPTGTAAPNGIVNASDIGGLVDCVKGLMARKPYTWCDIRGSNPSGGADGVINAIDIASGVDANKGNDYPGPIPTAPLACSP